MKSSNLFKAIESYLDDLRNFGDDSELALCENFFNKTKKLILEAKDRRDDFKILIESANTIEEKRIAEDFKIYMDNF